MPHHMSSNLGTGPTANDNVLDVACGTGIVARLGRKRPGAPAKVIGVDVSAAMLAIARGVDATIERRDEPQALMTCLSRRSDGRRPVVRQDERQRDRRHQPERKSARRGGTRTARE